MKEISPKETSSLISKDKSLIIIDARTPIEFHQVHIKNALLLDLTNPDLMNKLLEMDKTKPYLLYCHTGGRSFYLMQLMLGLGYKNIQHIQGGIEAWENSGYKVEK